MNGIDFSVDFSSSISVCRFFQVLLKKVRDFKQKIEIPPPDIRVRVAKAGNCARIIPADTRIREASADHSALSHRSNTRAIVVMRSVLDAVRTRAIVVMRSVLDAVRTRAFVVMRSGIMKRVS